MIEQHKEHWEAVLTHAGTIRYWAVQTVETHQFVQDALDEQDARKIADNHNADLRASASDGQDKSV